LGIRDQLKGCLRKAGRFDFQYILSVARFGLCGTVLWAQPVTLSPQDAVERKAVLERIFSPQASQQAWGAYLAANYQQRDFIPQIAELLKSTNVNVRLVAMDALIRLQANVPEEILQRVEVDGFDPILILLSRDVNGHAAYLMSLLDRPLPDLDWIATNSLLTSAPPKGFAGRLLKEWNLKLEILVQDSGAGIGGSYGSGCGDVADIAAAGFPPVVRYTLVTDARPGDTMMVGGVHPVYYRNRDLGSCGRTIERDQYRLDYLMSLEQVSRDDPEFELPRMPAFKWVDEARLRSDAAGYLSDVRAVLTRIKDRLMERGVLSADESALGPKVEVHLLDVRQNQSVFLPIIDWPF